MKKAGLRIIEPIAQVSLISSISREDGGPATGALELNRGLNYLGVHATLISQSTKQESVINDSVRTHRPNRPRSIRHSWGMLFDGIRTIHRSDIAHVHGLYHTSSVVACLGGRLFNTPYVIQVHGTLEPYQRAQHIQRKRLWNKLIGNRILERADRILFASISELERASDVVRPDQARVCRLGYGLAKPESLPDSALPDRWHSLPPNRRLVFLGRLANKKRPDLLIDAWAKSSARQSAHLVIAGPDGEWTQAKLSNRARSLGILESISFTGNLTPPQASWLLSESGLFVLPSENENFAIAVVEAMGAGCAVLVTDQVAACEFVTAAHGGWVIGQLSAQSLADQLDDILREPRELQKRATNAKEFARQNLSWNKSAAVLADIYHEVLAARAKRLQS